ncbi:MAG TPA: flippase-like domain-containing protein [Flavobacteriales bacterium]|nr:flippase-like domain-containing protein [Flavobacteriales bacterium]
MERENSLFFIVLIIGYLCPINTKHIPSSHNNVRTLSKLKTLTKNTWISSIIKGLVILLSFAFIYYQIFYKEDLSEIVVSASEMITTTSDLLLLALVFIMMILNWGIESLKWKFLIQKIETISFLKSFKAILAGTCVSIFTPNRIGEFGGRVFFLNEGDRIQASLITILGGMGQWMITFVLGSIALLIYLASYFEGGLNNYWLYSISFLVIISIGCSLLFFMNVQVATSLLNKLPRFFINYLKEKLQLKWRKYTEVFSFYSYKELTYLLLLSLIRYIVFTVQFYLLLVVFEVDVIFTEAILMIVLSFFVLAAVPTVALTELGVRGSISIFFIGLVSTNILGILVSSFALWIINLVIPALIGSLFVLELNFFRATSKQSESNSPSL